MSETTFKKLYSKLNKLQKEAVDTVEGPVMVIAGPGTGKTTVLTLRIANILRITDTNPENILALTFTESGVYSMRQKLSEIIGSEAYSVGIFTFHSFCNDVIRRFPEYFPRIVGSRHATDIEVIELLEKIITKGNFSLLKPFGNTGYYVRPILDIIKKLKREDIDSHEFNKMISKEDKDFKDAPSKFHTKGAHKGKMKGEYIKRERSIKKNQELIRIYEAYEGAMAKNNLYDYEDMIMEVVRGLETNEELRLLLQEEYQYILADEHQDANGAQNKLLLLLSSYFRDPNVFVVGDEKQAIYRFQGASLENFLSFKGAFKNTQTVILEDNYRSTQTILDASHSLIEKNQTGLPDLRTRLISKVQFKNKRQKDELLNLGIFSEKKHEYESIIKTIDKLLKKGTGPRDIAILFRDNKDAGGFIESIEKTNIPFIVETNENLLSDSVVRKIFMLFEAINSFGEESSLSKILYLDVLDLDNLDVYKLLHRKSGEKKKNLYEIIQSKEGLKKCGVKNVNNFLRVYSLLEELSERSHNLHLLSFFPIFLKETGLLEYVLSLPDSGHILLKLDALFQEMKELSFEYTDYMLPSYMDHVSVMREHKVRMQKNVHSEFGSGVRIMTAHRAKGLEFDYVFIPGLLDKHWGNRREINYFHIPTLGLRSIGIDEDEDERRLLYVALTRARKTVFLSYSNSDDMSQKRLPSKFLGEIEGRFVRTNVGDKYEKEKALTTQFDLPKQVGLSLSDKKYLTELFLEQGFSVTALNNYIKCPWRYFFLNLIRLPETPTKHQLYGQAVHEALKRFFDRYGEGDKASSKDLFQYFSHYISKKPFTENDRRESLKKGKESLSGYVGVYKNTWPQSLVNEMRVSGVFLNIPNISRSTDILLKGVLDKVEVLNEKGEVNVVDYKTSKPKSKNAIEGKTKQKDTSLKRQLVFYKLLLDLYQEKRFIFLSGELDFVEPDPRGKYKKERFFIDDSDTEILKDEIRTASEEILSFSFWDTTCSDKTCEHCRLARLLKESPEKTLSS